MNIAEGIAQFLTQAPISLLHYSETGASDTFLDNLPQTTPDAGVHVAFYHVGGRESDSRNPDETTALQAIVRGTVDPRTGTDMWYALYSQLHGLEHVDLPNGDHLIACIVEQAGPIRLGPDENGRHRFSMNLRCEVTHVTAHRS